MLALYIVDIVFIMQVIEKSISSTNIVMFYSGMIFLHSHKKSDLILPSLDKHLY